MVQALARKNSAEIAVLQQGQGSEGNAARPQRVFVCTAHDTLRWGWGLPLGFNSLVFVSHVPLVEEPGSLW